MSDREQKKAQFETTKKTSFVPVLVIGLVLLCGAVMIGWDFVYNNNGKYPLVTANNGQIAIPADIFEDGKAHFFSYVKGETAVDFFAVKSLDGGLRAAFDACDVCYREKKGYRQDGDDMVCVNCGQRFKTDRINEVRGGCNPAPLPRNLVGNHLLISEQELKAGARYFNGEGV